jgi:hypothetical protein
MRDACHQMRTCLRIVDDSLAVAPVHSPQWGPLIGWLINDLARQAQWPCALNASALFTTRLRKPLSPAAATDLNQKAG